MKLNMKRRTAATGGTSKQAKIGNYKVDKKANNEEIQAVELDLII